MDVKVLGPKDVAAEIGISERHATRLLRLGVIEAFRVGEGEKLWRTTDLDLESYIVRRRLIQRKLREAEAAAAIPFCRVA